MPRLYEDANPAIVRYIREALDLNGIELVWQFLGKKFGFNVQAWSREFQNCLNLNDRDISYQEQFMQFGKKEIEPILNGILCREKIPTWINLLAYLLKEKIEVVKRRHHSYGRR